jgi:hypothetical protein
MEISKYNKAMQFLLKPKYLTKDFIIQAASDAPPETSEGFANGGKVDPKTKMILDMLKRGADVDTISAITGATVEEINKIIQAPKKMSWTSNEQLDTNDNVTIETKPGFFPDMSGSTPPMDKVMPSFDGLEDPRMRQVELAEGGTADFQKKESKKLITEFLNPQEQALVKKFGNQVNSGVLINEIINSLPAKEAQILKAMGSKIGNIAKLGVRGAAELTVGLGPLGVGITALMTVPFALYDLSEGDRGSEVIQNTISDFTLGLTPRADERIIREIGGESAVRGMEIQQKIDEYNSAEDDLKDLHKQLNNSSSTLFSEDRDSLLASIERNKNIMEENQTYLQALVNDQGELISPDYPNYKKAENKQKLEKENTKQTHLERYNIDGGSDETQTEFSSSQLEQLKNFKGTLEKTYIGNQDKQKPYPPILQGTVGEPIEDILNKNYNYATGGRVGYAYGSKLKLLNLLKKGKTITEPKVKGLKTTSLEGSKADYGTYKFTGQESMDDLFELERQGKLTREDINVYDPRYMEYLDAQIINKEQLYTRKEWEKTPETIKNRTRGRIDPDWEEANFGEEFDWDQARSIEIDQTQKLKNFDTSGRTKQASGGRIGLNIDDIMNNYATGGRVGFEKGSKPPKDNPILPVNPMIDEVFDPSKRGFLKGAGAIGLGTAAIGTGVLKFGKKAKKLIKDIDINMKVDSDADWSDYTESYHASYNTFFNLKANTASGKKVLDKLTKEKKLIKEKDGTYSADTMGDINSPTIDALEEIKNKSSYDLSFNDKKFKNTGEASDYLRGSTKEPSPMKDDWHGNEWLTEDMEAAVDILAPKPIDRTIKEGLEQRIKMIERNKKAVGGRIGFEKGGKPPKDNPILPVNPMMDEGPQDPGKRTFIKGAGAFGLGAAAIGTGIIKIGKAIPPISEITKIVKGTTSPSWMDSLITKIIKEGIELKSDPNLNVLVKKVKFKNPKTGAEEEATLIFDKQKKSYQIEYSSNETVGGKYGDKVLFKVEPEYIYDEKLKKRVPTEKYKFNAIESEPQVVNFDGDIEMTGENVASKIIELKSDISGLKSYATGGKGINKKVVKEKEALVKRAEEYPLDDIQNNPKYSNYDYDGGNGEYFKIYDKD